MISSLSSTVVSSVLVLTGNGIVNPGHCGQYSERIRPKRDIGWCENESNTMHPEENAKRACTRATSGTGVKRCRDKACTMSHLVVFQNGQQSSLSCAESPSRVTRRNLYTMLARKRLQSHPTEFKPPSIGFLLRLPFVEERHSSQSALVAPVTHGPHDRLHPGDNSAQAV